MAYHADAAFWMKYWIKAYEYVLRNKTGNIVFVDFDRLVQDGERVLDVLADRIGLYERQALVGQAGTLRLPTSEPIASDMCPETLRRTADEIHEQLENTAVRP